MLKNKINLFEVYYNSGNSKNLLNRIIAPDAETAIRQSMSIFKAKLAKMKNIELSCKAVPLKMARLHV